MAIIQFAVVASLTIALGYLSALTLTAVLAAVRAGGRRQETPESVAALASSRLTIPVSIIVPAGDSPEIGAAVRELLDLNYPEFEVIVVVDQPATAAAAIEDAWALESIEFFYRRTLETRAVKRIFRSGLDPRLMVIEKEPGETADALNVGVNIARYRFVAVVPLGTTFSRDALLRAMSPALDDPRAVVGVFSPLEQRGSSASHVVDARFLRLRALRASMLARLFRGGLSRQIDGNGVRLWRRDAVLNAGGFSTRVARPDVDLAFRLVRDSDHRVVCAPEAFGVGPAEPGPTLWEDTRERQSAVLRVLHTVNFSAIRDGWRQGIGALLEAELLTPIAQGWVVAASVFGAAAGVFGWSAVLWCGAVLSFGSALVSAAAILLAGSYEHGPGASEMTALLFASPFEFLLVRPRLAQARLSAIFRTRLDA